MPIEYVHRAREPMVVYDAPVNEATQKIREKFDVDPETGYPRKYNWRPLAQLGPEYRPEDVYDKLLPYRPESMYSTYVAYASISIAFALGFNYYVTGKLRTKWYVKPYGFFFMLAGTGIPLYFLAKLSPKYQGREYAMYKDYVKTYPDRFDTIKRRKLREILYLNKLEGR